MGFRKRLATGSGIAAALPRHYGITAARSHANAVRGGTIRVRRAVAAAQKGMSLTNEAQTAKPSDIIAAAHAAQAPANVTTATMRHASATPLAQTRSVPQKRVIDPPMPPVPQVLGEPLAQTSVLLSSPNEDVRIQSRPGKNRLAQNPLSKERLAQKARSGRGVHANGFEQADLTRSQSVRRLAVCVLTLLELVLFFTENIGALVATVALATVVLVLEIGLESEKASSPHLVRVSDIAVVFALISFVMIVLNKV
jgi:hypothetical protein